MNQDDYRPFYPYQGNFGYPGYGYYPNYYNPVNRLLPLFLLLPFIFREDRENELGGDFAAHTVQEGEDLLSIAKKYNVPLQILTLANPTVQDPTHLNPGIVIHIPQLWDWGCQPMYMDEHHANTLPGTLQNNIPINPLQQGQYPYSSMIPTQRGFNFYYDDGQ